MTKEENERRVPKLRFKGFTDDWMQYKLEDLATHFDYGLNAAAKKFDGINKYLRITDIDESMRIFKGDDIKSPSGELEGKDDYLLSDEDIVFARTGASVGKSYLYDPGDGKVYFAGYLIRIKVNTNNSSEFIFYNTLTQKYQNFVKITSPRSGQPGINATEYKNYKIIVPKFDEQTKVGKILQTLDKIITLEQEKSEKLKIFIEQIFRMFYYQNWEFPLSFNKNNSQWKEITLKEILLETNKRTTKNNEYPILSSTTSGLLLQNEYFKKQVASKDNINYKILEKNQIVLSPQNLWLGNINYNDKFEIGIVSPSYKTFDISEGYDKYLLGKILTLEEMKQKYTSASEQGASVVRRNLNIENFHNIKISLPNLETQHLISNFIKNTTDILSKQNSQISHYSNLKEILLQNMLV